MAYTPSQTSFGAFPPHPDPGTSPHADLDAALQASFGAPLQATKPRFHLNVGDTITPEELLKIPQDQLINRSLKDPRYAGYDPNFNWREYLNLRPKDSPLYASVAAELDRYAGNENGQHVIRQMGAMQNLRFEQTLDKAPGFAMETFDMSASGQVITPVLLLEEPSNEYGGSAFYDGSGMIVLIDRDAKNTFYSLEDNQKHENGYPQLFNHEFGHAMDPISCPHNFAAEKAYKHAAKEAQQLKLASDVLRPPLGPYQPPPLPWAPNAVEPETKHSALGPVKPLPPQFNMLDIETSLAIKKIQTEFDEQRAMLAEYPTMKATDAFLKATYGTPASIPKYTFSARLVEIELHKQQHRAENAQDTVATTTSPTPIQSASAHGYDQGNLPLSPSTPAAEPGSHGHSRGGP